MNTTIQKPARGSEPTTGDPIRILVVDDSVVARHVITSALDPESDITVVGVAKNGRDALKEMLRLKPDLITLDVVMPEMDGIETLREIRRDNDEVRVIMFSTERTKRATVDALAEGANDYASKSLRKEPGARAIETLRVELLPKIRQFFPGRALGETRPATRPAAETRVIRSALGVPPEIVAIGVSTGGPNALTMVLPQLPANFPCPIVITQHMPPTFTALLAERLDQQCALKVREAADGMALERGSIYIARGGRHLTVKRVDDQVVTALDDGPEENSCRPAVDVMFRSVCDVYGARVLGVVLTGMGYDGKRGAELLKEKGAFMLAQDEASSVVWGMPGAIVQNGLADAVVGLDAVSATLIRMT